MALVCAAKSCKSHEYESDNSNLVFFPFPDDEDTCRLWVLRSGRHDLLNRTVEEIHLTEFLCEHHFEEKFLDRSGSVVLKSDAKPTIFDHDLRQFAHEILHNKADGNSVNPDIVVIPCVIMNGVNTEVIGFNGESIKEENINRDDIERELQLMREEEFVGNAVLSQNGERIDVHQQVINGLQPSVNDSTILSTDTLVVDSIHAVESSEWQEESVANLASQLCRICGSDSIELISMFGEQSIHLQIIDKIQWHLPIVIREDDKLPLKICTACISLLNSWHDLVTMCVETDSKLRKLFKIEAEFDPSASVYCDLNPASPDGALEPNVSAMQDVLNSSALVTQPNDENVLPLDEISLPANDDSIGLELSKDSQVAGAVQFFNEAKDIHEKTHLSALPDGISNDTCGMVNSQLPENCISSNESQKIMNQMKENNYDELCDSQPLSHSKKDFEEVSENVSFNIKEPLVNFRRENDSESIKMVLPNEYKVTDEDNPEEQKQVNQLEDDNHLENENEEIYDDVNFEEDEEEEEEENYKKIKRSKKLVCEVCNFSTKRRTVFLQHISQKHSLSIPQFVCEFCNEVFVSESCKKIHEHTHMTSSEKTASPCFMCEYCGRSFRTKKTLKEHHIAVHSDDQPYKCDKCGKNYGSLSSLDIHKATHSSETPYLCDLCGKTFKHVSNLRSHKRSHLDESYKNRQICLKCGKGFRSRFHLSEHMNVHEGNRPYTCEVCGKCFHKKIQLRQHGSAHSGTQPYKCPICGVKFNRRGNMTQHVKRHNQERKYTCRVCNTSFPTLGAVLNHRKKHSELEVQRSMHLQSGDDPDQVAFKCAICGKLLAKKESLSIHMRSHTGEKLFPCPECGKRLSNKGSLTYHMRSFHTGERPHACQFCDEGFLSKEARLSHERIHTGEKPFECVTCGMAFRCSSNLAQHSRVHSDARPHACCKCDKRFQRKGALDVHMRTHTGERPFACDVCGRAFTQKNDMLKHRRTHTNEKPYRCCACGAAFAQKRELTRHRLIKHAAQEEDEVEEAEDAMQRNVLQQPEVDVALVNVAAAMEDDIKPRPMPALQHELSSTSAAIATHETTAAILADATHDGQAHTVVITTSDNLLSAFPEITVPGMEHAQTVILQRF